LVRLDEEGRLLSETIITIIPSRYVFFGKKAIESYLANNQNITAYVLTFNDSHHFKSAEYHDRIHIIDSKQLSSETHLINQTDSIFNTDVKQQALLIKYLMEKFKLDKGHYLDLFKWMYSPARQQNLLPNYLYEIYKTRPQLQKAFPNPFGKDEKVLIQSLKTVAAADFELEKEFLDLPLLGSLEWAIAPPEQKNHIPSLLYEIYKSRPDLQKAFPEPFGKDEQSLLVWARTYLPREYTLDITGRIKGFTHQLTHLNNQNSNFLALALDSVNHKNYLPNILWIIYRSKKALQTLFPDPFRRNQKDLLKWAQSHLAEELDVDGNILALFVQQNNLPDFFSVMETVENTKQQKGINLMGYARAENGVAEACRMTAKSLTSIQIPFGIINYSQAGLREGDLSWLNKEITKPKYNINIIHVNADSLPSLFQHFANSYFQGRYNIGYWFWELPEFPDEWRDRFSLLNEVWVSSNFVQEAIQKKANIPVKRIPLAITMDTNDLFCRKHFGLPEDRFLFLAMYDTWSYQQRKNPWAAIETFKKTFKGNDPSVGLVLKVNNGNTFPAQVRKLKRAIKGYKNIFLITNPLSRKEVNSLINSSDCFVSLHRSEGFGIVIAESMYLGKPVIATNWSGNTDFTSSDNSCAVNYKLIELENDYGPYKRGQFWADPDINHAASFMKKLVEDPNWGRIIGEKGRKSISKNLSPQAVGKMIEKRLRDLNLI
jgi:glycosyltransferase involved in cell wall biosynthesis